MRSLFKKIVAVLVIGLILLGIARTPQVHKMAKGIDPVLRILFRNQFLLIEY